MAAVRGLPPQPPSREDPPPEVACEGCRRTVPRLQASPCASCGRTFCRLCVRWYGHFMLVCEECRAADW